MSDTKFDDNGFRKAWPPGESLNGCVPVYTFKSERRNEPTPYHYAGEYALQYEQRVRSAAATRRTKKRKGG